MATGSRTAISSASPSRILTSTSKRSRRMPRAKASIFSATMKQAVPFRTMSDNSSDAFSLYEKLGLGGVKTGYVNFGQGLKRVDDQGHDALEWHYGQYMVRHYQRVMDEAAKHHLMLDVHEPVKPTGLRRTYPNLMSGEGARGQEYNAWSDDGGNPPEHETILPFTRFLAGPMDFTPGIFHLVYHEDRPKKSGQHDACQAARALRRVLQSAANGSRSTRKLFELTPTRSNSSATCRLIGTTRKCSMRVSAIT